MARRFAWLPILLLVLGFLTGIATGVAAVLDAPVFAAVSGAVTAIAAIVLTFIIARQQDSEAELLSQVVEGVDEAVGSIGTTLDGVDVAVKSANAAVQSINATVGEVQDLLERSAKLIVELAERESSRDYEVADEDSVDGDEPKDAIAPLYAKEAISALQAIGAKLDYKNLRWQQKRPVEQAPGNRGWFVESPGDNSRWFVRKARGMTVRKAMPRDHLDRLAMDLDPREIRHDFQLKEHGLAAWYARTYEGDLWRVGRSNRNPSDGIQATLMRF